MSEDFLKFDDVKIEKCNFHFFKIPISLNNVDININ